MTTKCQMWRNKDGTYHNDSEPCKKSATRAVIMPDGTVYQWCDSHHRMATFSWHAKLGEELQEVLLQ